jgi:hypothetical protein
VANNVIDFSFESYRRSFMFLKKPYGADIPKDFKWKCGCGTMNDLNSDTEQWCPKCGSRLRIQTQKDEEGQKGPAGGVPLTIVRVSHITVRDEQAKP